MISVKVFVLRIARLTVIFASVSLFVMTAALEIECLRTAFCWMTRGDVRRTGNREYKQNYEQAREYIQRHIKFKECGIPKINEHCEPKTKKCEIELREEAIEFLPIPRYLIDNCEIGALPYMLLLCPTSRGWWPEDIVKAIQNEYRICGSGCNFYEEYHEYHLKNGKVFPRDFPRTWEKRLNESRQNKQILEEDGDAPPPPPPFPPQPPQM